ncbi:MAG: M4 family metallopeptidase [Bacteroidia bacterium]
MRTFCLFLATILLAISVLPAQELRHADADAVAPGAKHVWLKKGLRLPKYVKFEDSHRVETQAIGNYVSQNFDLVAGVESWQKTNSETDKLGHQHDRYQQVYQGFPVEGSMLIVHSDDGKVYSFNGDFYTMKKPIALTPTLMEAEALDAALASVDAQVYKWDVIGEENYMKRKHAEDPVSFPRPTFHPEGELVIVPDQGDFGAGDFRLAWKFDIYAQVPVSRADIFVDAVSGEVLCEWNKIHTADSAGTADTRYSGTRNIIADNFMGSFRLRESGRGNGVRTFNMQNGTDYNNAVDFTDNDNDWDFAGGGALDNAAGDAHWGSEMTYDYYLQEHGRNSIDGNGFALESYINYDQNFNNAFWDGRRMTYGDGGTRPFTAIDISSHEVTHGLTTNTANLIYQNESGALNESFSDIFGKAVENFGRPNSFTWNIGQDIGAIRDMADPNRLRDPKNYLGNSWFTGAGDNGGVHINSGVQNHWFYLLVEGDQGTNDFGEAYDVPSIDWDTASAVAFRNLTVYLTPNSNYADARFFAIESAIDLYGSCTRVHQAVTNAWHAVGVGRPFSFDPISDFDAFSQSVCSEPYKIQFRDQSLSSDMYSWVFGDGNTSTQSDPSHTYANPGTYSVELRITGLCGGFDTLVKTSYITVNQAPDAPVVTTPSTIPCRTSATLQATAPNLVHWYDSNDELIGFNNTFVTPKLNRTTTFYARNVDLGLSQLVGPANSGIGNGRFFPGNQALLFEVYSECRLSSAWVNAGSTGDRDIILSDANGNVLETVTVNIPQGQGRITLDIDLTPGSYQIGGAGLDLFRNDFGVNYPYEIPGLISITGSTANQPGFYYFLYDWEVNEICTSAAIPVTVPVDGIVDPTSSDVTRCGAGQVTLTATHPTGDINWYDANGNFLSRGNTYTTQVLGASRNYFADAEEGPASVNFGPANPQAVGGGGYFDNNNFRALSFEVFENIRLRSAFVDAGSAGTRTVTVTDSRGNLVENVQVNIPAGQSRVTLDIDLLPGSYFIGGEDMDLYRNNGSATFPYEYPGLVRINESNAGTNGFYYFFYDWEIQEAPCFSGRVPVRAIISQGTGPTAQFAFTQNGRNFQFNNQSSSSARSYYWDFGDGNTSTAQNPFHTYGSAGTFTVTLVINDGTCSETTIQTVESRLGVSIDPTDAISLKLYPNPGQGNFVVTAEFETSKEVSLVVIDAFGREVYRAETRFAQTYQQNVDLTGMASGAYFVRLQAGDMQSTQKYLLK